MSTERPSWMAIEIAETPEAIARLLASQAPRITALGRRLRELAPPVVVTGARGSSDHAVGYFKYLVEIFLGVPVASVGPSIASVYRAPMRLKGSVLVSVSQSGQSPDIIALQEAARQAGALCIAVVNDARSGLAEGADEVIDLGAGVEQSVAATKTCLTSAAALAALVTAWSGSPDLQGALPRLASACETAASTDWTPALPAFRDATSAYVLGRGPALPVASEAALKLKETSVLHAEAFSGAEVLHGPMQLLQPGFPVLAFCPDDAAQDAMDATLDRLVAAGGRLFRAGDTAGGGTLLPTASTGHWALDPLPMLLSFYRFAEELSRVRGHDPDRPAHLSKVTRTV